MLKMERKFKSGPSVAPEITADVHGKLFQSLMDYSRLSDYAIRSANDFYNKNLPRIIESYTLIMKSEGKEYVVKFKYQKYSRPEINSVSDDNKLIPLWPHIARDREISYMASVFVTAYKIPKIDYDNSLQDIEQLISLDFKAPIPGDNNDKTMQGLWRTITYVIPGFTGGRLSIDQLALFGIIVYPNIEICKIPIVLRSQWCYLSGMTNDELLKHNECPNDPFGYVIIRGREKYIINQEKSISFKTLLSFKPVDKNKKDSESDYFKEKSVIAHITIPNMEGSKKVSVFYNPTGTTKDIKITADSFNTDINPLLVFDLLLGDAPGGSGGNYNRNLEFIAKFTKPTNRTTLNMFLQPTMVYYNYKRDEKIQRLTDAYKTERGRLSSDVAKTRLIDDFRHKLFPQMRVEKLDNDSGIRDMSVLGLLSTMIIALYEYSQGDRKIDNLNSWSNRELDNIGKKMEGLFKRGWRTGLEKIQTDLRSGPNDFRDIISKVGTTGITSSYDTSFTTNVWGQQFDHTVKNISDTISRESGILLPNTQMRRITIGGQKTIDTREAPRRVQMSQVGFVSVNETPERAQCGLNKYMGVTTDITGEGDEGMLFKYISSSPYLHLGKSPTPTHPNVCLMNGKFVGWCDAPKLRDHIIDLRRERKLPQTNTYVDTNDYLIILDTPRRPVRPLLVVKNNKLMADKKIIMDTSFNELLVMGWVEYVDPSEQEHITIAQSIKDMENNANQTKQLNKDYEYYLTKHKYNELLDMQSKYNDLSDEYRKIQGEIERLTKGYSADVVSKMRDDPATSKRQLDDVDRAKKYHDSRMDKLRIRNCELTPGALLSVAESIIPFPETNPSSRVTFQCKQGAQSMSIVHSRHLFRFDGTTKVLAYPQRPVLETQIYRVLGLDKQPAGENVVLMISPYFGYNQEDAIVINKASVDRGLFRHVVYFNYDNGNTIKERDVVFGRPAKAKLEKLHAIMENGYPRVGSRVKDGDVLIGIIQKDPETGQERDRSVTVKKGQGGIVERVLVTYNIERKKIVKVKIRQVRRPSVGDKYAPRYSQKGVIAKEEMAENFPFIEAGPMAGKHPDVIINPHSFPSRMTMGLLMEMICGITFTMKGERMNATAFQGDIDMTQFRGMMKTYGMNPTGSFRVRDGRTGNQIVSDINVGLVYYQALKHTVEDKAQMRGHGLNYDMVTRGPVAGRDREGGIRIGRQELAALVSSGAAGNVLARTCTLSDSFKTVICKCGNAVGLDIAIHGNVCVECKEKSELYTMNLPYSTILLTHHLRAAGINMRFVPRPPAKSKSPQ